MMNLFLYSTFFIGGLSLFQYSFLVGSLNRTYLGLFKGVAEASIIAYSSSGTAVTPYFSKTLFEKNVNSYFQNNEIPGSGVVEPTFSYEYGEYYSAAKPNIAYVSISHPMGIYGTFDKTARFEVVDSENE